MTSRSSEVNFTKNYTLLYNDLVRAVDNNEVTALVLLDLSSAFDTVDHATLLNVLHRAAFWCPRVCNGLVLGNASRLPGYPETRVTRPFSNL